MKHSVHPACAAWPMLPASEFAKLVEDIKANGLYNPIWLTPEGQIIDGKNRYQACEQAGVEPLFRIYEGDDPIRFTISQNARRRRFFAGAMALVGARLLDLLEQLKWN